MSSRWTSLPGLSGACARLRLCLRDVKILHVAFLLAFSLSACGDMGSSSPGSAAQPAASSSATAPSDSATIAPLMAPPGSNERPPSPGSLGRPIGADGLPALQPAKGVNVSVDTLFTEDIRDPIERIKRVETAVIEMRRDFDATMPAIKRLVAIEQDIQLLTSQLETLLSSEPPQQEMTSIDEMPAQPAPLVSADMIEKPAGSDLASQAPMQSTEPDPAPQPAPAEEAPAVAAQPTPPPQVAESPPARPPPETAIPPPATPAGLVATGLRLGEHADKTRIVIDVTGSVTYRHDLDNSEKFLVIELDNAGWSGVTNQVLSSPLVQSWSTQALENGKGTRIILVLSRATDVIYEDLLPPESGSSNYRLVIDLKK
jgi:N-acetylmuramoyl-L-alanine amidase